MNKPEHPLENTLENISETPSKQTPIQEWLEVGTIVAPQGLQGEIRVYPQSDFPERFQKPGQRWLQRSGQEPFPVKLIRGRYVPGKDLYIITLEGITSCEAVDALRGCKLVVPQSVGSSLAWQYRPQLPPDQFHVLDLIGLGVYHQKTGVAIGTVVDIIPAGNDLLEVELTKQPPQPVIPEKVTPNRKSKIPKPKRQTAPQSVTVLIPFVHEIVPIVDLAQQRIEVNPPVGLLEINLSPDLPVSDKPQ